MSWLLIERNEAGWKHYKDSHGNSRYQKPNGQFASPQQWGGGISKSPPEPVPIDAPPVHIWKFEDASDKTRLYDEAFNWFIEENRVPIDQYPISRRLDQMENKTKAEFDDRDISYWSIETVIIDKDGEEHEGRRRTSLRMAALIGEHREHFREHYLDLMRIASNYDDVLVLETGVHRRRHDA